MDLPTELQIYTLSFFPLRRLRDLLDNKVLRPYVFSVFFRNIIVSKTTGNDDGRPDDYEITNKSSFKVDVDREYVKFGSINSFLAFCSSYENFLSPEIIELESIWNLFPLHKLSPTVLARTKSLRINNPNTSFIIDASTVYLNYFNIITSFSVNGFSNYKCFANEDVTHWENLRYLAINNINSFDFSKLYHLPNLETVEINNCQNINFDVLAELSSLRNLYIDSLPEGCNTPKFNINLRTLLIGNVTNSLNFNSLINLAELTILSCASPELDFQQLQIPSTISLSLNNSKINLVHLPPTERLTIKNCTILDGDKVQDLTNLSELNYNCNNCLSLNHPITFQLSTRLMSLNVQLMKFFSEIGKIHFQSNDDANSSAFTITDDDSVSYFNLPNTLSKLTLNSMSIDSRQSVQFPNDLTWLDLTNNNLTDLANTNISTLTSLLDLNLTNNDFKNFNDLSSNNLQIIV